MFPTLNSRGDTPLLPFSLPFFSIKGDLILLEHFSVFAKTIKVGQCLPFWKLAAKLCILSVVLRLQQDHCFLQVMLSQHIAFRIQGTLSAKECWVLRETPSKSLGQAQMVQRVQSRYSQDCLYADDHGSFAYFDPTSYSLPILAKMRILFTSLILPTGASRACLASRRQYTELYRF